uniref:ADP-ribosylation factor-like protein 14 n=1 Tax=Sinocyclocheilus grahami TaxID=75366 RepID=A0A672LAA1_SINGR
MGNSFSNISAFQSLHIVMLGLDSAGKTTVLYRLKFNEFVNTVPTIGFNTEKIKLSNGTAKGISCHFWDVGGQEKLRPLWKSYSRCTDGIIYVVDSVDVDRLEEAKTELHKVTKFAENQGTPLLVIANKQDLPKSLSVADIEKQLALQELTHADNGVFLSYITLGFHPKRKEMVSLYKKPHLKNLAGHVQPQL